MTSISTTFTGVTVTGVTANNPGVVSTGGHTLSTGDVVLHEAMDQMTELNGNLFEIEVNGNDWWIKTAFGGTARLDLSAFTAETSGGTASLGLSTALVVPVAGDDITVTLTGTWVATIALEKEIGFHSNAWTEVERWTANTFRTYQSKAANQRWRLRLITWTSGTITGVLADVDKVEETFLHDDGTPWLEVTQAGATFQEDLNVLGDLALSGTIDVVTANSIEAGDSSLGINGIDAAQGGAVVVTGGTSSTGGNAGGAARVAGGVAGATGAGGAVSLLAGSGGASSGAGGSCEAAGGDASASNSAGGSCTISGGNSRGSSTGGTVPITGGNAAGATGAGGAASIAGGSGNTTGLGGAASVTGGAGGNDAVGGAASLTGGAAGGGNRAGGAASVVGGAGQGTAAGGALNITTGAAETGAGVGPGASGALTVGSGAAGGETSGSAGASGAVILESATGGASDTGQAGASGAVTIRSGAGGEMTTSGTNNGGAAGAVSIAGGTGGAETGSGAGIGGIGGDVILTAGDGGTGNTAGAPGTVALNVPPGVQVLTDVGAVVADTGSTTTMTTAVALSRYHSKDPAGAITYTTPDGALITAEFGRQPLAGESFMWTLLNTGNTTAEDISLAAGTNTTMVGPLVIHPAADTAEGSLELATWMVVNDAGGDAWTWYRVS